MSPKEAIETIKTELQDPQWSGLHRRKRQSQALKRMLALVPGINEKSAKWWLDKSCLFDKEM